MTISPQIGVQCRCGIFVGPIHLPDSILALVNRNLKRIIPAFGPIFVACPQCHLVFDGSVRIRPHVVGTKDLRLIPANSLAIRARRVCGVDNCGSQIEIQTTVAADKSTSQMRSELERRIAQWDFDLKVRCSNTDGGHYLRHAEKVEYEFDGIPPELVN
jgi:hypothetical protein